MKILSNISVTNPSTIIYRMLNHSDGSIMDYIFTTPDYIIAIEKETPDTYVHEIVSGRLEEILLEYSEYKSYVINEDILNLMLSPNYDDRAVGIELFENNIAINPAIEISKQECLKNYNYVKETN